MIEIVVHPPRQCAEGELLVTWDRRADGAGPTDGHYAVHDGGYCAGLMGAEPRRTLAGLFLPGVVVDANGRLLIDTDENGVEAARLIVAAAIARVETWCALREEASTPAPIPAHGTHGQHRARMVRHDVYGAGGGR